MSLKRFALVSLTSLALVSSASAQTTRKPGLWELTTTMTWQQAPFPAGMNIPGSGAHTIPVCLTQQQIDKYGGIMPSSTRGTCQVTDVVKSPNGMTASMVCTGAMAGKGTFQSSWTDSDHATGNLHFTGTLQMGSNSKPVEWTTVSSSVFKGADCGNVKPRPDTDK